MKTAVMVSRFFKLTPYQMLILLFESQSRLQNCNYDLNETIIDNKQLEIRDSIG